MNRQLIQKNSIALKICGITQAEQALAIASLGVNAIGVIGVKNSPRFVEENLRIKIFQDLTNFHPEIERVYVVADIHDSDIEKIITSKGAPSVIQLHGSETKQRCKYLSQTYSNIRWWKAFRIRSEEDLSSAKEYEDSIDALLLDSWSKNQLGGTGQKLNIKWLEHQKFKKPWWLAGGVSEEFASEVLKYLTPFGLDASSRLEISPGVKDLKKVRSLLETIKSA
tara:strand:+ start:6677 stop:7348 length:672 start_codon:yes stop_codon:yes gene_type:complete